MAALRSLALIGAVAQCLSLPRSLSLTQSEISTGTPIFYDEEGFLLSSIQVAEGGQEELGLTSFAQTHSGTTNGRDLRVEQSATASILRSSGAHPWSYCNSSRGGPGDQMGDVQEEANFMKFFESVGGSKLKLALASVGEPAHRGTVAKEDIKDGDMLLSIPFTGIMSGSGPDIEATLGHLWNKPELDQEAKAAGKSPFWYTNGKPNYHRRLALWLLFEKSKGQSSKWDPYISMLPRRLNVPLDYDATELDMLRGTSIFSNVMEQRKKMVREYEMLFPMLHETESTTFIKGAGFYDLEDWKWARGNVNSRCMVFPANRGNDIGLVPFADMVNHHNVPVSWISYNGKLGLKTAMPFKEGEEVFMNYGHLSNQYLLQVYGFILPDNEYKQTAGGKSPCTDLDCIKALEMSTTLAQDEELLEKKQQSQTFNYVNALNLRIEEQEILRAERKRFSSERV